MFGIHDLTSVYHVSLLLQSRGIVEFLTRRLELEKVSISDEMKGKGRFLMKRWKEMAGLRFFSSSAKTDCSTR